MGIITYTSDSMKKCMYFSVILFITFCFLGCAKEKKDIPENFIRCLNCNGNFKEEPPLYTSVKYIKLETSPECFIGHIRDVYIT
ncbi:MAG: hypothetical protein LIO65_01260, partial [Odoribacter sp.]|nr:hypothetical protein [Odoribacter sp.]